MWKTLNYLFFLLAVLRRAGFLAAVFLFTVFLFAGAFFAAAFLLLFTAIVPMFNLFLFQLTISCRLINSAKLLT